MYKESSRCAKHPLAAKSRQSGAALLMAILTVALVALIGSAILADTGAAIAQLSGRNDQAQARWLARGAIEWARNVLQFDEKRTGAVDHLGLGEEWNIAVPPLNVDEGKVSGQIIDLSGRFNLNTLVKDGSVSPAQKTIFLRLLRHLNIQDGQALALADAIIDWIDSDQTPLPQGAEQDFYSRQGPRKTLPPNAPLLQLNELLAVRNVDSRLLELLRPHLAALPADAIKINVNTATPAVLAAHIEDLSLTDAATLVGTSTRYYKTIADFNAKLQKLNLRYSADQLDIGSRYFLATGRAQWGETVAYMQVLLRRNTPRPDVVHEMLL